MSTPLVSLLPPTVVTPVAEEPLYEVINGQRVEISPMSAYEVRLAAILIRLLDYYAATARLGRVVGEMLFSLDPQGEVQRRPEVAFVSYDRWPRSQPMPRTNAWPVVPELVIEVVSPTNYAEEPLTRMTDFFRAGSTEIWIIYPSLRHLYCYRSPTQVRIWTAQEELTDCLPLPGLRLPLSSVFEEGDTAS